MAACANQSKLDPETEANLDWFAQSRGNRTESWPARNCWPPAQRSAIDRALRAGRLHRVHRGVYAAVAPELLTEEGHLVAALLAAGDGAPAESWDGGLALAHHLRPSLGDQLAVPRDHAAPRA